MVPVDNGITMYRPSTNQMVSFIKNILFYSTVVLMGLVLYMVFMWVPTDANLGISQRIFYVHVPLGMIGLLAVVLVAFGSFMHLITRDGKWDSLAHAAAELGVLYATLILVTGSMWAKPAWGVWWTWDAKLTTTLVLWFIYVGYLMLRAYGPGGSQGAVYASVDALIGIIVAPIIYLATVLWRTAHPELIMGPVAESGAFEDPRMELAFRVSLMAFALLFVYLLIESYSLKRVEADTDELYRYDN